MSNYFLSNSAMSRKVTVSDEGVLIEPSRPDIIRMMLGIQTESQGGIKYCGVDEEGNPQYGFGVLLVDKTVMICDVGVNAKGGNAKYYFAANTGETGNIIVMEYTKG